MKTGWGQKGLCVLIVQHNFFKTTIFANKPLLQDSKDDLQRDHFVKANLKNQTTGTKTKTRNMKITATNRLC